MFKLLRYVNWSELSGLLVGAVLAIVLCLISYIVISKLQQEGILGKEEYTLYSDFISGQGLHKGTKVMINGVEIGAVESITLSPRGLVRISFSINTKYKGWITDKSEAYATRDQNIISERVINIDISKRGSRILENGESLLAGTAQDIETVLKVANEAIDRLNKLIIVADTLLQKIVDTNTTIGMLLGSNTLYSRLDLAAITANRLLNNLGVMINFVDRKIPSVMTFADTLSTNALSLMSRLDNLSGKATGLIGSLDTTVQNANGLITNLSSMTGAAGNLLQDGSQTVQNADDLMKGLSTFWFIRNKIPKRDSVPVLEDSW